MRHSDFHGRGEQLADTVLLDGSTLHMSVAIL
jgi:hypothetical protein